MDETLELIRDFVLARLLEARSLRSFGTSMAGTVLVTVFVLTSRIR